MSNIKAADTKTTIFRAVLILLILADAVFIFVNSSLDAEKSSGESGKVTNAVIDIVHPEYNTLTSEEKSVIYSDVHVKVRETAHFLEYVPIGFFGALLVFTYTGISKKGMLYLAAVFFGGAIYAISDEIHQHFSDGRASEVSDILTDSLGCLLGILTALALWAIIKALRNSNSKRKNLING